MIKEINQVRVFYLVAVDSTIVFLQLEYNSNCRESLQHFGKCPVSISPENPEHTNEPGSTAKHLARKRK